MKNNITLGLALVLVCKLAFANDIVFTDGNTKILIDYKQNKMYCTNCGFGNEIKPIAGPIPAFEGIGSGVQNYFKAQNILIVRTDMGRSCDSGEYTKIDLNTRTSKNITLPSCKEETVTYSSDEKGRAVMRIRQGKKVTTVTF